MPDNEVTVRIVADTSDLKVGAQDAAQSVERMGSSMEMSAAKTEKLQHGLAHLTTHLAAHAVPGSTRMAMAIARMGEAAVGVGPLLAVTSTYNRRTKIIQHVALRIQNSRASGDRLGPIRNIMLTTK